MNDAFRVHRLNEVGLAQADAMAKAFEALVTALDGCGMGHNVRYRALVMTKLEEAAFFAKKSMASDPHYQER